MRFAKYHALGNDYLVLTPADGSLPAPETVREICHRHYGLGSDGILYGPVPSQVADFGLRILNPDGSEAEKSGNGLRIFGRYLYDQGQVQEEPFTVETAGGFVTCRIMDPRAAIEVEMGVVSFWSDEIGMSGERREALQESLSIAGHEYTFCAATIGNPHCVLIMDEISAERVRQLGPTIEHDPRFTNRTNVQLMKVLDPRNIQIEIWERGAGYTFASGSSSCAAGAVARRLGLVNDQITVHMPGGEIQLTIGEDYGIQMTGPVTRIGTLHWEPEN